MSIIQLLYSKMLVNMLSEVAQLKRNTDGGQLPEAMVSEFLRLFGK